MILASPVDLTPLLKTPGTITPRDVVEFRKEVFRDGLVSKHEADAIFMINDASGEQCGQWHEFFVEAITDFVVDRLEPRGTVSVENGEWLIRQISRNGILNGTNELEVLVKIIEKASRCPQFLVAFALDQVAKLVISGQGELINSGEPGKGIIGKSEAELIRRIIYSVSGSQSIAISKCEAQLLFELNDNSAESKNHPAWNDLFVKAIASHLMAASGYTPPDRQTAFAQKEWPESVDEGADVGNTDIDVAGTLKEVLSSFASAFSRQGIKDVFKSDHQRVEEAWEQRNVAFEEAASIAEKIDASEAHWLVERIGRDKVFHENEKALIRFLKDNSPSIHPSLQPLLGKVA